MWRIAARRVPASQIRLLLPSGSNPQIFAASSSSLPSRHLRSVTAAGDPIPSRIPNPSDLCGVIEQSAASPAAAAAAISGTLQSVYGSSREAILHYGRCYWELSKAKLSMLVVATSGSGFILGSGNAIDYFGLCSTCAGTMMVAASANSLNQIFEIKNDALMKRTRRRPLPSGRISIHHAAIWASGVGIAGTTLLASTTNYLAAGLATSNLVLYAFVYTPLKQIHPVNTWVGAIVGAIPPLLGWAASSGEISLNSMILPAALYFWQIPHFMALAYLCRDDYIAGGYRMFSLEDISGQRTALVSFRNCLYLFPLGYLAYDWGIASQWFALESLLVTLCITASAFMFVRERTVKNARRMFRASLVYLPVFMTGLLIHRQCTETEEADLAFSDQLDMVWDRENRILGEDRRSATIGHHHKYHSSIGARPPVAFASIAPFPFLPVPQISAP